MEIKTVDLMHMVVYKSNKPTSRIVRFGNINIRIPRGVYVSELPDGDRWIISLKNLKAEFRDIVWVTQVTARMSKPHTFANAYREIMIALAMSDRYRRADHSFSISNAFKNKIGTYGLYHQYKLTPIRGICLNMMGTSRIRVRSRTKSHFSYAYGTIEHDNVTYVRINTDTRDALITAIKVHIHKQGAKWLDSNADAQEFLKKF